MLLCHYIGWAVIIGSLLHLRNSCLRFLLNLENLALQIVVLSLLHLVLLIHRKQVRTLHHFLCKILPTFVAVAGAIYVA